jgi:hypothetical protein
MRHPLQLLLLLLLVVVRLAQMLLQALHWGVPVKWGCWHTVQGHTVLAWLKWFG